MIYILSNDIYSFSELFKANPAFQNCDARFASQCFFLFTPE